MKLIKILLTLIILPALSFAQSPDWISPFGSNAYDGVQDLHVFTQDSFVAVGEFDGLNLGFGGISLNNTSSPLSATFIVKGDANGNFVWAHSIQDQYGLPAFVEVDNSGNIYLASQFDGNINLQPGGSDTLESSLTSGNGEIYLVKYSPSGNVLWKQKITNSFLELADMSFDGGGGLHLTGSVVGRAYTRNRADTLGRVNSRTGFFIATLSSTTGALQRENTFYVDTNLTGIAQSNAITSDGSGNVYVVGEALDNIDLNPSTGARITASAFNQKGFVARYSSSGTLVWHHELDVIGNPDTLAEAKAINVIRGGSYIYVQGQIGNMMSSSSYTYDFGGLTGNIPTNNGGADFFCKINIGTGTIEKVQFFEKDMGIDGLNILSDSLYIFGSITDTTDFDPGPGDATFNFDPFYNGDAYVALYDTGFAYLTSFVFGDSILNGPDKVSSLDLDSQGKMVLGGEYGNAQTDFQPGAGTNTTGVFVGGGTDAYVARYNLSQSGPACDVDSAGPITGPVNVCQFDKSLVYSIDTVGNSNATNFIWSFTNGPPPAKIVGQGTRTITIDITNDPFTIEVTPSNSICQGATSTLAINNPGLPPALADTVRQQPNCGQSNGSIDVEVTNSSPPPYTYIWSNGDILDSLVGLPSGSYTVSVTDDNGCFSEKTIALNDLGAPQIDSSDITDADCFGDATGAIDISVSGGATPYSYFWSNGDTAEDPQNLQAGGYRVEISDSTGCRYTEILIVGQPNALSTNLSITDATSCGASDGQVTAFTSGGVLPYTVNWSPGGSGNSISSLSAGSYSVTITDDNLCTYEEQFAVSETGAPVIGLDSIGHEDCLDTNGYVATNVTGGTSPSYSWSNGASGSLLISNLGAGIYTLSVTDGSCTAVRQFEVEKVAPESFPICMVTVDDSVGRNIVVWEKPYKSTISSFEIMRESWQDDVFIRVAESHVDTLSQYIDFVADPKLKAWTYSMITHDVCGASSEISAEHTTMHLVMQKDTSGPIELNWNAYGGLQHSLYYIERLTDTTTGWVTIDSVSAPLTTYIDTNPPKQFDLLYAIAFDHPGGACQTSRAAPKKYGSIRSSRSINGGENPTIGIEPPDTTLVKEVEIPDWGITVFPNPSSGIITIRTEGILEKTEMRVLDLSGRTLMNSSLKNKVEEIDLSPLGAGVYLIQMSRGSDMRMQRIVIQ